MKMTEWFRKTAFGQRYLTERVKFRLARWLNRFPSLCWAQLALWALNVSPWWTLLPGFARGDYTFAQSCRYKDQEQYPYCGKCFQDDRWLIGCTPEQRVEARQKWARM